MSELENDPVMEEFDLYLDLPNQKHYMLNWATQGVESNIDRFQEIREIRRRPMQHSVEIDVKVNKNFEGIRYNNPEDEYLYTLVSQISNLRGAQYAIRKVQDKLMLLPIERVLTMRRKVDDAGNYKEDTEQDSNALKNIASDQKKQVEAKMRSYKFQKELLETEEWRKYQLLKN